MTIMGSKQLAQSYERLG